MKFLQAREATSTQGAPPREYLSAVRHVTVAELLSLRANPIKLIPAPGPGKLIVLLSLIASGPGGTPYSTAEGNLTICYGEDVDFGPMFDIESALGYAVPFLAVGIAPAGLRDVMENGSIDLMINGAGELLDGDFPIDLRIEYEIVDL